MHNTTASTIGKTVAGLLAFVAFTLGMGAIANADKCHANGVAYPNTCHTNR